MDPTDVNQAKVNNVQWSIIWCQVKSCSAVCWLSQLTYWFANMFSVGEAACCPWVAALNATAVSALQGQSGAGGWQYQCAKLGLNRRGNWITLGGGPCSVGQGSFSCWGWCRKKAVVLLAELSPHGIHSLLSTAEVVNGWKNYLDIPETDESYYKHTITAVNKVSHISCSWIWLIIWALPL